jgi:hypothetical protein
LIALLLLRALAIRLAIATWRLLRLVLLVAHGWRLPVLWWPRLILVWWRRPPLPPIDRALTIMRNEWWLEFIVFEIRKHNW